MSSLLASALVSPALAQSGGLSQSGSGGAAPAAAGQVRAVLELFTSQGCSSCPPADALLETLVRRDDVIALSYAVDYWDYLGWKDTLASPKFSARQKHYAKARGDGRVYTPQMVVNGLAHATGSSADLIEAAIQQTEAQFRAAQVPVTAKMDSTRLTVELGEAPGGAAGEGTVWLALVDREVNVAIERGENRGRTVRYVNVVREFNPIGMWTGKAARFTISRDAVAQSRNGMCVVLVQSGKAGPIVGAAVAADGNAPR